MSLAATPNAESAFPVLRLDGTRPLAHLRVASDRPEVALAMHHRQLPLADACLGLADCRHLSSSADLPALLTALRRTLSPGGALRLTELIVPGSTRRGKAARRLSEGGDYLRALISLRAGAATNALSTDEWRGLLLQAGFAPVNVELSEKRLPFAAWVADAVLEPADQVRLRAMVWQAPGAARDALRPERRGEELYLSLQEARFTALTPSMGPEGI